jgi:putative CocE/NonD family hydrolase
VERAKPRSYFLSDEAVTFAGKSMLSLGLEPRSDDSSQTLRFDHSHPFPTVGGPNFLPGLDVGVNTGPRDQRHLLGRDDLLCFVSEASDQPFELTGEISAELFLTGAEPGLLFVGRVLDIWPDGSRFELVSEGGYRIPANAARPVASPAHVIIDLGAASYSIPAGHRIGLMVSNGSFPRYQRHVSPAPEQGTVEVLSGPRHPSSLIIPVIESTR